MQGVLEEESHLLGQACALLDAGSGVDGARAGDVLTIAKHCTRITSAAGGHGKTVAALLNDAWRGFWRDEGCGFRGLEQELVSKLERIGRSTAAR